MEEQTIWPGPSVLPPIAQLVRPMLSSTLLQAKQESHSRWLGSVHAVKD